MSDLKNPKVIIAKGLLFVFLGCLAGMVLLLRAPGVVNTLLLCLTIWAFCRFYYFAFYVIQNYVDSRFRFSGLLAFFKYLIYGSRNSPGRS